MPFAGNQTNVALMFALVIYFCYLNSFNDLQRIILLNCVIRTRQLQMEAILHERHIRRLLRRLRRRVRRVPYFWMLPRPAESWFDIHYNDAGIPGDFFRDQLRLNRQTFTMLLNVLRPRLTRQNTFLRDCISPEKILAVALYRLAHGNSYLTIVPNFNVGKSTVIEAVQDVVEALCDLRHEYIRFPVTNEELIATRVTFEELTDLPNVIGAVDGTHKN